MRLQISDFGISDFRISDRRLLVAAMALGVFGLVLHAQNPEIDAHVAAAKAAVGRDHQVLFTSLCSAEPSGPGTRRGGPAPASATAPAPAPGAAAKETWHAEPVKVFDNLYFLGMKEFSAWAVTTS